MDERLKFIARLLDGEMMSTVCREFNISRKTGYKLLQRYRDSGLHGLTDRSRRPYRQASQLPVQVETLIVRLRRERPGWGAPKIRERLRRLYPDIHCPAISTVHAVLDRHGLVKRRTRRRNRATGTPLSHTVQPNELWCADYKGEFMLADRRYCYPLTITDYASRYLIACEALATTKEAYAFSVFERAFREFGYRPRSGPTTASHSLRPTRSSTCRSSRSGGSGSASRSSGSSPATRSRTAVTSACISPSSWKQPDRQPPTSSNSRANSTTSSRSTTQRDPIRRLAWPARPSTTPPHREPIRASRTSNTPSMTRPSP